MIYYTLHYMNPYIYMDNREDIVKLLRLDDADKIYNQCEMYYNMHFDGVIITPPSNLEDDIIEFIFKLSNGIEDYEIPKFQIPLRSPSTGDIVTLYDDNKSNPRSYMYKPFDHIKLKKPVVI